MSILDEWYKKRTEEFIIDAPSYIGLPMEGMIKRGWLPLGVNAEDPRVKQIVERIKNGTK
jgi:hypothetical protein